MKKQILYLLLVVFSLPSYAFSIDNMVLVSNADGNGVFTLTSNKGKPEYIKGEVSQIKVIKGKLKKVSLTKDNIPLWDLAIAPTKLILNPGERRRISVKNLCQKNCKHLDKDKVYQIAFNPAQEDLKTDKPKIGIEVGYAPFYIIPAENAKVKYSIKYDKKNNLMRIKNQSNTFLYMQFDVCEKGKVIEGCKSTYTLLAGRERDIKLHEVFKNKNLKVHVATYDYGYKEDNYVSTY